MIQHPRTLAFHCFQFLVEVSIACHLRIMYYVGSAPTKDLRPFPLIWATVPLILDGSQWNSGYFLRIADFLTLMFNKFSTNPQEHFDQRRAAERKHSPQTTQRFYWENNYDLLCRNNENTLRELV